MTQARTSSAVPAKLAGFISQMNEAAAQAKAQGISYTPAMIRQALDALIQFTSVVPDLTYVCDKRLESAGHSTAVRVYSPAPAEALPVVIYVHGGGGVGGSLDLYDPVCRKIALAGQCIVISVDYRLAPEHPYPAAVDDCDQVVIHYRQLLTELHFSDELILAGDSAGGAVVAGLSMRAQSNPALRFDKQILIYPSVDFTLSSASIERYASGYLLEKSKIDWYYSRYFHGTEDLQAISPLFTPLDRHPVASLVLTAELDPLHDEGLAYYQMLVDAGVYAEHHDFAGMTHMFINLEDLVEQECRRLYELIGNFVKRPV